jgi:exodeoxyribonuclease-3
LRRAGYGAKGAEPIEVRRGLPGNPADDQSRYIEARVHGLLVACIYLPNGNPQPGPKFDYKLAWFERLIGMPRRSWRAATSTSTTRAHGVAMRCCNRRAGRFINACSPRAGSIRYFWDYFRRHWERDAGLRIDHVLLNQTLAPRLLDAGVDT